jgi:L-asparagine oxygenase
MAKTAIAKLTLPGLDERMLADAPSPYSAPTEARLFATRHGRSWFTSELERVMGDVRLGRGPAAVCLAGVPAGLTTARTPSEEGSPGRATEWSSEACLLGLATALGQVYGYMREHRGAVIQQIVALPGREGVTSSESADVPLPFHTENSFARSRPDFVLLLCRRPGPIGVPTHVLDVDELRYLLPPLTIEALSRPIYRAVSPASFGEPRLVAHDVRVLDLVGGQTGLRLDLEDLLTSDVEEGRVALRHLFSVMSSAGTSVVLQERELLIIDNRRAAHARRSFQVVFDGNQRWLQRCLVRSEFWSCRAAMKSEGVLVL